jgi:hypothetical protein
MTGFRNILDASVIPLKSYAVKNRRISCFCQKCFASLDKAPHHLFGTLSIARWAGWSRRDWVGGAHLARMQFLYTANLVPQNVVETPCYVQRDINRILVKVKMDALCNKTNRFR